MEIELQDVSKFYGTRTVLDQISLRIPRGRVGVLLGANGAGKTTLLRCLSTILCPDEGVITFDGKPLRRDDLAARRRLHFLPDVPCTLADDTVLENIGFVLQSYGIEGDDLAERAVDLLDRMGMLAHIDTMCKLLSRGQLYKTALCAMILVAPDLWLLDEPFASGMDPQGLEVFRQEARAPAERGCTVVYSTQIVEVAETLADWFGVLNDGELELVECAPEGVTEAIRERLKVKEATTP